MSEDKGFIINFVCAIFIYTVTSANAAVYAHVTVFAIVVCLDQFAAFDFVAVLLTLQLCLSLL